MASSIYAPRWPPPQARQGDLVILGGWPETFREEGAGGMDFHFASFITRFSQDVQNSYAAVPFSIEGTKQ